MILVIDSTSPEKLKISLCRGDECQTKEIKTGYDQLDLLFNAITELLKANNLTSWDIRAVAVNHGPGAFTSLRTGITFANTFAWVMNIPVFDFDKGDFQSIANKCRNLLVSKAKKFVKPVIPRYNDNIGR